MPKLTSNPVCYERVAFNCFARGILDLEQRCGSIECAALGIKYLTPMLLFVDTNDLCEIVRFLL